MFFLFLLACYSLTSQERRFRKHKHIKHSMAKTQKGKSNMISFAIKPKTKSSFSFSQESKENPSFQLKRHKTAIPTRKVRSISPLPTQKERIHSHFLNQSSIRPGYSKPDKFVLPKEKPRQTLKKAKTINGILVI